jgi:DNA uptake protein ComE-like DNA-binding protein
MPEHDHPGQKEPRSYGRTHHEELDIDLNQASEEQLAELPMVGPEKAKAIIENRPFESWADVKQVPGFSSGMVDDLKSGGATLGGMKQAA